MHKHSTDNVQRNTSACALQLMLHAKYIISGFEQIQSENRNLILYVLPSRGEAFTELKKRAHVKIALLHFRNARIDFRDIACMPNITNICLR